MSCKLVFRFLTCCLLINHVYGKDQNGLEKLELLNKGFQFCGPFIEPSAFNKVCCYNKAKKERSEFYYKDVSICCNGEVYDKLDRYSKRRTCCNNEVINGEDFVCCEDNKLHIPTGYTRDEVDCCGNMTRTKDEMCCIGNSGTTKETYSKNIGCCDGKSFSTTLKWCQGNEIMNRNEERCGNTIIDLWRNSCCNGVVTDYPWYKRKLLEKYENRACCGEKLYNSSTHTCCPNYKTIIPKDSQLACCGHGSFNITSKICCDSKTVQTRQYGKDSICCGGHQIDIAQQGCCDEQGYNKNTSKCCLGWSGSKAISVNEECCNGQAVTEETVCCNSIKLIKKSESSHNGCCLKHADSEGVSYNTDEKICKDGVMLTKRPDGVKLCGEHEHNPTTHICCHNQLIPITEGAKLVCCGFKAIDEYKQKCCKGYDIDFPTDTGICCSREPSRGCYYDDVTCSCAMKCNNILYNPNNEICCGKKVYSNDDVRECCGSSPLYNNGNQTCCNGVRYDGNRECCGRKALKEGETCCGDFVVQGIKRKSQKCCSKPKGVPYDPRFSVCNEQSGYVFSKLKKIYSSECRLSNINKRYDIYGWIPAACNSRYGFQGTITNITSKWDKLTGRGYQMITLTGVRSLKGKKYRGEILKFRIAYKKQKNCFSRHKRLKNKKVALFTSANLGKGYIDFVDHEISLNEIRNGNNEFYVTKVNRHFRHTYSSLKRSLFCQFGYQYKYTSLIR